MILHLFFSFQSLGCSSSSSFSSSSSVCHFFYLLFPQQLLLSLLLLQKLFPVLLLIFFLFFLWLPLLFHTLHLLCFLWCSSSSPTHLLPFVLLRLSYTHFLLMLLIFSSSSLLLSFSSSSSFLFVFFFVWFSSSSFYSLLFMWIFIHPFTDLTPSSASSSSICFPLHLLFDTFPQLSTSSAPPPHTLFLLFPPPPLPSVLLSLYSCITCLIVHAHTVERKCV